MADSAIAMPFFGLPYKITSEMLTSEMLTSEMLTSEMLTSGMLVGNTAGAPINSDVMMNETLEWAKFCMWLRGYLSALEGKELTTEDSAKIMEKLATVDPDSQARRIYDPALNPYIQPFNPIPKTGEPPIWTYTTSTSQNTSPNETDNQTYNHAYNAEAKDAS